MPLSEPISLLKSLLSFSSNTFTSS